MITDGKRCEDICKFAPPEKGKWPCEDCDMRYHDRAEPKQEDSKSTIWIVEEHFVYSSITRCAFSSKEKAIKYLFGKPNLRYSREQDMFFAEYKDSDGLKHSFHYIIRELEVQ